MDGTPSTADLPKDTETPSSNPPKRPSMEDAKKQVQLLVDEMIVSAEKLPIELTLNSNPLPMDDTKKQVQLLVDEMIVSAENLSIELTPNSNPIAMYDAKKQVQLLVDETIVSAEKLPIASTPSSNPLAMDDAKKQVQLLVDEITVSDEKLPIASTPKSNPLAPKTPQSKMMPSNSYLMRPSPKPSLLSTFSKTRPAHSILTRRNTLTSSPSVAVSPPPKINKRAMSYMYKPSDFNLDSSSDSDDTSLETLDSSEYANSDLTDTELLDDIDCNRVSYHRNVVAFWLLGVCHKMTYLLAIEGSRDVLHLYATVDRSTGRACVPLNWLFILSEVIPALAGKFLGMLFPLYPSIRMIVVSVMSITGCLLASTSHLHHNHGFYFVGLAIVSCSGGVAEALYLSYSTKYHYSTLTAFSSGSGFGIMFAILFYAALRAVGLEVSKILVLSLLFVAIECGSFFVILMHPCKRLVRPAHHNLEFHEPLATARQKFLFVPQVLPFMFPYTLQYLAQYLITRGANPMQIYGNENITPFFQVTYISFAFSLGNLLTRSFGTFADQRHLWMLAFLQAVNCASVWIEVTFSLLPQLWQALVISFLVGVIGGSTYLNTHYLITKQQPSGTRQFSHSFAVFGEQLALTVALVVLKPLFNFVCETPMYRVLVRLLMYHYYG